MTKGFRQAPPAPPLPDGLTVERYAVAMAAANGVVWLRADAATAGMYRRAAHGLLIVMGSDHRPEGAAILGTVCDEATQALRLAARKIEADTLEPTEVEKGLIRRLYRAASAVETAAQALMAVNPEPEESV